MGRNGLISKNPLARKIWVRLEKDLLGSLWGSGAGWKLDPEWVLQGLIPKAWGQRIVVCKAPLLYFMLRIGFGAPNSLVGECYNFPILQRGTRARRAKGQLHATRLVAEKLEVRGGCPDCLSLPHDFPATRDEGKGRGLGGSDLCDSQRPSAGQARGHQTSHPHPGPSSSGVPKAT